MKPIDARETPREDEPVPLRSQAPPLLGKAALRRVAPSGEADRYVRTEGPVGDLYVAFNERGICHVLAATLVAQDAGRFAERHLERFGRPVEQAATAPEGLAQALRTGSAERLRYDLRGRSDFETAVLRAALGIPRGEVRTYAWVASEIGRPRAVRAAGSALGRNPVPVLIPCHRVVRSDGGIGDYAFGAAMKRLLLVAEGFDPEHARERARSGAC